MDLYKNFDEYLISEGIVDKIYGSVKKGVGQLFMKKKGPVLKNPELAISKAFNDVERAEKKVQLLVGHLDAQLAEIKRQEAAIKLQRGEIEKQNPKAFKRLEMTKRKLNEVLYFLDEKVVMFSTIKGKFNALVSRKGYVKTDYEYKELVEKLCEQLGKQATDIVEAYKSDKANQTLTFVAPSYRIEQIDDTLEEGFLDTLNSWKKVVTDVAVKWYSNITDWFKAKFAPMDNTLEKLDATLSKALADK